MRGGTGRILRGAAGLLVSALFCWLAFRSVSAEAILRRIPGLPLAPILTCCVTQVACQALRVYRWGILMRCEGAITRRQVVAIGSMGVAAVSLLPARLGEIVRPVLTAEETSIGFMATASTVLVERLVDGWLISVVLLGTLLTLGGQSGSPGLAASGLGFVVAFALAGASSLLLVRKQSTFKRAIEALIARFSPAAAARAVALLDAFVAGLLRLAALRILIPFLSLSVLLWALEALSIYLLFAILSTPLSVLAALTVLCALVLGVALPAGPAHLGLFEYAAVIGLGSFGVAKEEAALYGALLHVIQFVVLAALGVFGVLLGGISLERFGRIERRLRAGRRVQGG